MTGPDLSTDLPHVWLVMREGMNTEGDEWTEILAVCATEAIAKREEAEARAEAPAPNVVSQDVWIDEHEVVS
jgi:hypothetical protein